MTICSTMFAASFPAPTPLPRSAPHARPPATATGPLNPVPFGPTATVRPLFRPAPKPPSAREAHVPGRAYPVPDCRNPCGRFPVTPAIRTRTRRRRSAAGMRTDKLLPTDRTRPCVLLRFWGSLPPVTPG